MNFYLTGLFTPVLLLKKGLMHLTLSVHCCNMKCVHVPRNEAREWILLEQILLSRQSDLVLLLLYGLCSAQSACTSCSNKTDLATSRCIPPDCWGFANMLMVTTTEGMLNRLCGEKRGKSVWGILICFTVAVSSHWTRKTKDPTSTVFLCLYLMCCFGTMHELALKNNV